MTTLAVIAGISLGWIVGGAVAAALPVIAHLLARRGGRPLLFPAVWFIAQAAAEYARRRRLRDRLLLALRILAILLLALAFDRPTWSARPTPPDEKNGRDVVIIIDTSASMTRTHLGRTIFDAAVDQARTLIADLTPRDRAAIIFAAATPRTALPRLTANLDALTASLNQAESTLEHADLAAAIALSASLPGDDEEGAPRRARRVILVSDRQRSQWQDLEPPSDLDITLRLLGPDHTTPNLALLDARLDPPHPALGAPALFSVRIVNRADEPRSPTLTINIDGRAAQQRTATLGAAGETTLTIPVTFTTPGQYGAAFSLVDERYTVDDAAFAVADIRATRRIALITRAAADDATQATYFLHAALRPDERSPWQPTLLPPDALSAELLNSFDAAALVNAGAPDPDSLAALHTAVQRGLGLLWIVDSPEAHTALTAFEAIDAETTALPTRPVNQWELHPADDALGLARGVFDAPPLTLLQGGAGEALMNAVMLGVSPARLSPVGFEVLGYDRAGPCLAWSRFGDGRIATLHADLAPARSSLVKSPIFPVLAHELPAFLAPGDAGRLTPTVGLPFRVPTRADLTPEPPVTQAPSGRQITLIPGIAGAPAEVACEPVATPGLIRCTDQAARTVALAAVNLDPRETDTTAISDDEIKARFEALRLPEGVAAAGARAVLGDHPIELWPWIIVSVIALLAVESLLANRRGLHSESDDDA
ncbi:MAG: VWA domain-containing protein [Phycisphaerales bacterium]|nr:VWA domain-containing protein [Phycisphaerales bacterium]